MSIPVKYDLKHFGEISPESQAATIKKAENGDYIVLLEGKKSVIRILNFNSTQKTFKAKVNGITVEGSGFTELDLLIQELGFNLAQSHAVNEIHAPMPGLVLDIKVAEGEEVSEGDALLVLEAMKMENVIKSPGAGKVKTVHVSPTDSVEKGQLLVEFE